MSNSSQGITEAIRRAPLAPNGWYRLNSQYQEIISDLNMKILTHVFEARELTTLCHRSITEEKRCAMRCAFPNACLSGVIDFAIRSKMATWPFEILISGVC